MTLSLYRKAFSRAGELTLKNWPVLITVFVYAATLNVAAIVAGMLGLIGGFLYSLVFAACIGSFLYIVEMMVRTSRVSLDDFKRSFGAYLWDVIGVVFLFWLFSNLAIPALMTLPQGHVIILCAYVAVLVLCNAVPELIYLGHFSALALVRASYDFVVENWVEWFPANILAGLIVAVVNGLPLEGVLEWLQIGATALLIYFVMVMRGLLFIELHGTSRRSRAFRHRMGS